MSHPVQLEITSPVQFDRIQLLLRLALAVALAWLGVTASWLSWLLFLCLPVIAAIAVSTRGSERYLAEAGPRLTRAIAWLLAFSAYMLLLVDRFPLGQPDRVHLELPLTGRPTTGSALLRLITSIPSCVVLALLGVLSWLLFVVGAVTIVIDGHVPASVLGFQRGILRWQARLLAYHASLVDEYPPFSFEDRHAAPGGHAAAA
jgi:hypothetical protein